MSKLSMAEGIVRKKALARVTGKAFVVCTEHNMPIAVAPGRDNRGGKRSHSGH